MSQATVVALVSCVLLSGCTVSETAVAPPRTVRLASARGIPLFQNVAQGVNDQHRGFHVEIVETDTASVTEAVADGRADFGIASADSTYFMYLKEIARSAPASAMIRAIATLEMGRFHLLAAADSNIRDLADLPGHTVAIVMPGIQPLVLEALGVSASAIRIAGSLPDAVEAVHHRETDAALFSVYPPSDAVRAEIEQGARLIPLTGHRIDELRHRYRWLRPVSIPPDTYPGHTRAVHTLGVAGLVFCRRDLDEELVYQLTKGILESLPTLSQQVASLKFMDVSEMPATPIPLHDGAARYYRELELLH